VKKEKLGPPPELNEVGVPWDENMKFTEKLTVIEAKSFQRWVYSVLPQVKGMRTTDVGDYSGKHARQLGGFHLVLRRCPVFVRVQDSIFGIPLGSERWQRTVMSLNTSGKEVAWNSEVLFPVMLDPQFADPVVWMSLTPMEVLTQRAGVKRARGKVLMGGLGMGWMAQRVLEREQVEHVTVYDTNEDVLDFFGGLIKAKFKDKVTLRHGDVFSVRKPDKYDRILLDVWSSYHGAEYDQRLKAFKKKVDEKKLWTWGYKSR
jgi:hypothetical protein